MTDTKIEWTDKVWNPVRGCTKISPGCKHCYAETFAERFRGVPGHPYEQGFDLRLVPHKLEEPLRWRDPAMVFVNSMSDPFHEDVPDEYIDQIFAAMAVTQRHTYQVLTKRADRLQRYTSNDDWKWRVGAAAGRYVGHRGMDNCGPNWPLPNVWLGVSCEDREYGLPRLEYLRETPAALRMVSFEPLLEDLGQVDLRGIDWAIIGGESGDGARPMLLEWARSLIAQCKSAGTKVFVKQLGARPAGDLVSIARGRTIMDGRWMKHPKGGDPREWPGGAEAWPREFPEVRRAA